MPRTPKARASGAPQRGPRSKTGKVFIVGAGPGDPELLTLRAFRLMNEADAVVYDQLVGKGILAMVPAGAQRIYAGKKSGNHSLPQDEINKLLVGLARRGKKVLRLKGGDPFVFGRGGEESQFLADHGVPFEIVPGVTSASGAACYTGIPLTHRDYAQACVFVTGHPKKGGCELEWSMLARPAQTVVIYMGLGQIREICAGLIEHGRGPDTPVAVVEHATTDAQRVVLGTLRTIAGKCTRRKVRTPSIIIVGEVVGLHGKLSWFVPAKTARHKD
jgi:uroporphyrin-III C-methyltransferase / precorrin-2 dehydrogenase / sirohydrochlorin ferrochelatase